MKQYFITSLYTEGTQTAIQQDHAGKELFKNVLKNPKSTEYKLFIDYIENHKTTVALGVGQPTELLKIYSYIMFHKNILQIPVGLFLEDSLNKTPTCLSFVASEKLCVNIQYAVQNMLKNFGVTSLYDLEKIVEKEKDTSIKSKSKYSGINFKCKYSGINFKIQKNNDDKLVIDVLYMENPLSYEENHELIQLDIENEEVIKELYVKYNEEDAAFFLDLSEMKKNEMVLKNFKYSIEELNFLLMIKSLRLK